MRHNDIRFEVYDQERAARDQLTVQEQHEAESARVEQVHRASIAASPAYMELRQQIDSLLQNSKSLAYSSSDMVEVYRAQGAIAALLALMQHYEEALAHIEPVSGGGELD